MFVISLLEDYGHWTWLSLGLVLVAIEIAAPGAIFLWVGIAAGATGLLVAVAPELSWKWQLVVFAVLAVASTVLGRRYVGWRPIRSEQPGLNRRGAQLVGREYVLDQDIVNGRARLKIGDSSWLIEGPDLVSGKRVRVTAVTGSTLQVEPADPA